MNAPLRDTAVEPVAELFAEHGDLVYRTLQYLGVPEGSVDDALQDVFITAHRRWDAFEGRASPRTWLYGIARRVAWRYRRNHKTRGARFVLTERPIEGAHAPFEQANARRSVQALLEGLDDHKRAAFVLVEVEGFTAAEAAELLEVPLGTVYSRVRAAWARLRDAASEDLEVASMRAELEPERRDTLQRALLAACIPTAPAVAATGIGALGWLFGAFGVGTLALGLGISDRSEPTPTSTYQPAKAEAPDESPPPIETPVATPAPTPTPPPAQLKTSKPKRQAEKPPAEAPPPVNTLAEEAKLIRKAEEQARSGNVDAAREAVAEHERRFPQGQLVDEREQVRRRLDGT